MFVTVIAHKYTLLVSRWSRGHFLKLTDSILFEQHDESSPFNSTQYIVLYPQNGDRIVIIDSVTSLHSMYWSASRLDGGWLGSRVASVLDSGAEGPGLKSQSRRCRVRVTVLGKLFTPIVPLFTKQQNGSSPLKGCGGNCGPGGK